jgi:ATP-dependent exoDNAse (exonuclease V) beta subunit
MQWENLLPLIDNALASENLEGLRGSLMIVGDPKQSIYRWRGGRAEQFIALSKGHNPFVNKDSKVVQLERNYRSCSAIINFNNSFFAGLAEKFEHDDYMGLYRDNSFQECNDKEGGYVNITFLPENPENEEGETPSRNDQYLEATLNAINAVRGRGFNYGDIVLLTRKRQPGVLLANYLTENGIPILSSETLLIENAAEVKLIISLLRYLKNNDNVEAKAHFLYFVAAQQGLGQGIHDFISGGMALQDEQALEQWLGDNGIVISFCNCRRLSLYEAVETIIGAFIKEKSNQSYVQYFLDLVLERDICTQAGIPDFLEYWDNNGSRFSIPSPEGNDAVRIMTIHKSKGLEFPVVIFPFAEEDYSRAPRNKMWLEMDDEAIGIQKALIDSKKEVAQYGEKAAALYHAKNQEELLDNINILYVALTRAEEQLYIISAKNFTNAGLPNNMSSFFIGFLQEQGLYDNRQNVYEFGSPARVSEVREPNTRQHEIEVVRERFSPRYVKIAQRESLMWGTTQLAAIEFGNVMHEVLSFVDTAHDIPVAVMRAVESGLITQAQRADVAYMLEEVTGHPELVPYFNPEVSVYREQSIIRSTAGTIKPDRVAVKDGKAWLLDYKTGAHLEKYRKQLDEYQRALEAMGLTVAGKALVYIGEGVSVVPLEV